MWMATTTTVLLLSFKNDDTPTGLGFHMNALVDHSRLVQIL
jgi:hypothetical protein